MDDIEGVTSGNDEQRMDARLEARMKWRGSNGRLEEALIPLVTKTSSMMIMTQLKETMQEFPSPWYLLCPSLMYIPTLVT